MRSYAAHQVHVGLHAHAQNNVSRVRSEPRFIAHSCTFALGVRRILTLPVADIIENIVVLCGFYSMEGNQGFPLNVSNLSVPSTA